MRKEPEKKTEHGNGNVKSTVELASMSAKRVRAH